ncbi:hypothetical protein [Thermocrinis sp.]
MLTNKLFLTTGLRFLLFILFTIYTLFYVSDYNTKAVMIVLSALYITTSLIAYFYPWKLKRINDYFDYAFVFPLAFLSGEPMTVFSLLVPALYTFPKKLTPLLISVASACVLLWLSLGFKGLSFLPLVLALSLSPSSINLLKSLQKERKYLIKLKSAYRSVQSDLMSFEKEKREKERLLEILKLLDRKTPEEYLTGIKEMYNLKAIKVLVLNENSTEEVLTDYSRMALSVPVKLEYGKASVVFYLNHPAELMDEYLKKELIQCARLLNLYIAGFEDSLSKEQTKIAV